MTLNADQERVSEEFFAFLLSPNQKEYTVSGPPGVGKTFLLQQLIDRILPTYQEACQLMGEKPMIHNFALCATTNKAAEVLSGSTGIPTQTIHKFLNLKVTDDFETGRQTVKKTPSFDVHHHTLVLCDESSMIDSDLYRILHEGTDKTCKIVYVGDSHQLAPVGEKISKVFAPHIQRTELRIPVRNAHQPALMALCDQMRQTVETGVFQPLPLVPGVIEQLSNEQFQIHVDTTFAQEGADSRILAYTNAQVIAYNSYIRQAVRGYGALLEPGELVVNNQGHQVTRTVFLPAELELRVTAVDPSPKSLVLTPDLILEAYQVTLENPKTGSVFKVHQPLDPHHLKEVSKYLGRQKMWPEYFRLKGWFPDLRARDASTVHKAQGSTFESVYLDLQNIGTCNIPDQVARMLYVGASRARSRVYLYGHLPPKYRGGS